MTLVSVGLVAQLVLAALAVLAGLAIGRPRARSVTAGVLCIGVGLAGSVTGLGALFGPSGAIGFRLPVPGLGDVLFQPSPLGGLFVLVAGAVGAVSALFGIGYAHGPAASRTAWTALALFMLGLQFVPAAADVVGFLLAWEAMALASTVLVLTDHRTSTRARSAGVWYAVMTHLSFLLVLVGFAVLAANTGTTRFAGMAEADISQGQASIAFIALLVGFATKAGAVPLHVWLPKAHPEAPSHVSALMSAAMVKMGVYGIVLAVTVLLPGGPAWWGGAILVLALPSALYGILQAAVANDIKRLLAYSTTENVGLMLTATAVAVLTRAGGIEGAADVALTAALLLVVSHAAFKTVLFLGAGAVVHATQERDLDNLGGLAASMPVTAITTLIGALGAAALPVTVGFVAEWSLLQALIRPDLRADRLAAVWLPLILSVVALTAGLALLTFVKMFGIAFLARPRTDRAAQAVEVHPLMRVALVLGAGFVLVLGLAPAFLARVTAAAQGGVGAEPAGAAGLRLPGADAMLDPLSLTMLAALLAVPLLVFVAVRGRRVPRRRVDLQWGCGGVRTSPRMQYTATSYAEPLVRVFEATLSPSKYLNITHADEMARDPATMSYAQQVNDQLESRIYRPITRSLLRLSDGARAIQNGSIHRYLAFSFVALLVVLIGATL